MTLKNISPVPSNEKPIVRQKDVSDSKRDSPDKIRAVCTSDALARTQPPTCLLGREAPVDQGRLRPWDREEPHGLRPVPHDWQRR